MYDSRRLQTAYTWRPSAALTGGVTQVPLYFYGLCSHWDEQIVAVSSPLSSMVCLVPLTGAQSCNPLYFVFLILLGGHAGWA